MTPQLVEGAERVVVQGVAPAEVIEVSGWIVALDHEPISRARSAAPLSHAPDLGVLDEIVDLYAERGLPPAFRLADVPGLEPVREALEQRGYAPLAPTVMKTAPVAVVATYAEGGEALDAPDESWATAFCSEGFDPEDSRGRLAMLSRARDTAYGAVREGGRTLAVGVASFGHGWAGVSGMRTVADRRGEGLAGRVMAAMAREAQRRGIERILLQVEEDNPGAQTVYRRIGFTEAWTYRYWRRA